jgi:hypothetical protein
MNRFCFDWSDLRIESSCVAYCGWSLVWSVFRVGRAPEAAAVSIKYWNGIKTRPVWWWIAERNIGRIRKSVKVILTGQMVHWFWIHQHVRNSRVSWGKNGSSLDLPFCRVTSEKVAGCIASQFLLLSLSLSLLLQGVWHSYDDKRPEWKQFREIVYECAAISHQMLKLGGTPCKIWNARPKLPKKEVRRGQSFERGDSFPDFQAGELDLVLAWIEIIV